MPPVPTRTQRQYFHFTVDSHFALNMLENVEQAVSGASLEAFLMGPAHDHFENEIVQRFAYGGDRQSGNWPELQDSTQEIRSSQGFAPDWPINVRTNELFHTVTDEADFMFGFAYAEMILPGGAANDPVVKAKLETAQMGRATNPIPEFGPTPPRPVLAADETDLAALLMALDRWIVWQIAGMAAGGGTP